MDEKGAEMKNKIFSTLLLFLGLIQYFIVYYSVMYYRVGAEVWSLSIIATGLLISTSWVFFTYYD